MKSGGPAGRPVQLKYALAHQIHSQSGTISESDISMGKAVAQLTGNYQIQGEAATLDMKLNAQNMPVDDLEAMLPALGSRIALGLAAERRNSFGGWSPITRLAPGP